jgi:hypothetical protein
MTGLEGKVFDRPGEMDRDRAVIARRSAFVGLVFGIKALSGPSKGMAIVAVVLCSLGLIMTFGNMALGVYLAVSGQHPLVNQLKGQL